jgi:hypothetical protein
MDALDDARARALAEDAADQIAEAADAIVAAGPVIGDLLHDLAETRDGVRLLVDSLPMLRQAERALADEGPLDRWAQVRHSAWREAEDEARRAWQALAAVEQLLRGLAGVPAVPGEARL